MPIESRLDVITGVGCSPLFLFLKKFCFLLPTTPNFRDAFLPLLSLRLRFPSSRLTRCGVSPQLSFLLPQP